MTTTKELLETYKNNPLPVTYKNNPLPVQETDNSPLSDIDSTLDAEYNKALEIAGDETSSIEDIQWAYDTVYKALDLYAYPSPITYDKPSHSAYTAMKKLGSTLTSNPNVPLKTLINLAEYYPSEFLNNIALDLHLLKNPGLFTELMTENKNTLKNILEVKDCPYEIVFNTLNYIHSELKEKYQQSLKHDNEGYNSYISTYELLACEQALVTILVNHPTVWNAWKSKLDDKKEVFIMPPQFRPDTIDLSNINFTNVHFFYVFFHKSFLEKTDFTGCIFEDKPRFGKLTYVGKNPTIYEYYKEYKIAVRASIKVTYSKKTDLISEATYNRIPFKKSWKKDAIALAIAIYDFEKQESVDDHGYPFNYIIESPTNTDTYVEQVEEVEDVEQVKEVEQVEEVIEEEVEDEVEDIDQLLNSWLEQAEEESEKVEEVVEVDQAKKYLNDLKNQYPYLVTVEVWGNVLFLRMSKGRCIFARKKATPLESVEVGTWFFIDQGTDIKNQSCYDKLLSKLQNSKKSNAKKQALIDQLNIASKEYIKPKDKIADTLDLSYFL
jgi:hypothetical protein